MLTVAKVTAGGGAGYAAYLEGKTVAPEQGDYYLKDGERVEAPGRWALADDGAVALGVDRSEPVDGDAFRALMAVRHPVTGEPLRRVGANGEAVVAIDATFSAPKSVSAVWALASPELRQAIELAQERAVDRALAHAREHVAMVRRRVDSQTVVRERAREVLASSWQQSTARAVSGRAPDPQLHSHVLVHGALRGDGRVVAVESRAWLVHQREIGAAYRSQLAQELERLGFEIERGTGRGGRYFEVAGVPDGLRERWSSRHRQVSEAIEARLAEKREALRELVSAGGVEGGLAARRLDALERSGRLMPAEERRFAISSRAGKGTLETAGDLDREWWQTAIGFDFNARSVEALRERGRERDVVDLERELLSRLTEFDATFAPREARAVALETAAGLGPERGLAALTNLRARSEVLELADRRLTTRAHRALERRTVAVAAELATGRVRSVDQRTVAHEAAALGAALAERGGSLAPEQERALRVGCSDRQLVVLVGQAGTGKSTALVGVARAHERAGREIVVTSTGAQAAQRLAGELLDGGVSARGYSTVALHANVTSGRLVLGPDLVVLHDEAALASTREQAWLLDAVRGSGARLVAIGDPRQSQAVGAAGLWPTIEQLAREQGALVELSRIVRARDPADRRDQALWRAGEHERALDGYLGRGRLVLVSDQRRAEDRALEAAHSDRAAGRRTLVIAQTSNEQLDALNARAQAIRHQESELGHDGVPVSGRPYALYAGDEVIVRAPLRHPELGPVRNGVTADVIAIDPQRERALVRLADGREGGFDRELIDAGQLRLAYVSHPFPAQGQTTDTTHVIAGPLSTAEGTYVSITRARETTHIYANHDELDVPICATRVEEVAALAQRLGRSEPDMPSISVPLAHEQRIEHQHAQLTLQLELEPATAERAPLPDLEPLRADRDQLRELLATYPAAQAARVRDLQHDLDQVANRAQSEQQRMREYREQLERLGPFARRGERGHQLRERIAARDVALVNLDHGERVAREQITAIQTGPDSPARWETEHPGAREALLGAERAFEHAVDRHAEAAIEHPGAHITRVLDERPTPDNAPARDAWDQAARAVERYRVTHRIDPNEPTALGPLPKLDRHTMEQHSDWRDAGEHVLKARETLEIAKPGWGPIEQRLARIDHLIPEREPQRHLERGLDRDL